MAEEKKKDPTEVIVGTYVGKEFSGKGNKKDGTEWKSFKLKLKINESDKFNRTFDIFEGCKGFDEIEEGDMVKAGYVLKEPYINQYKKEITPKLILWIGKTDEKPGEQTTTEGFDISNFSEFRKAYLETAKENNIKPNATHMLGSYVLTYSPAMVAELKKKCEETIE